jgi:hypothetical protein
MATALRSLAALLALAAVAFVGPTPAAGDPPARVSSYYLGRGDPRACPSPICGGIWIRLLNRDATPCAGALPVRRECYVANLDLSALGLFEHGSLADLVASGRAIARGKVVMGRVQGFPELATLLVSEVWPASSSKREATGRFWLLRDNGRRCVTTPCFSTHAALLNTSRHLNVSELDRGVLPQRQRLCAFVWLQETGMMTAGRVVRVPHAGPAGAGRRLVATQFYVRKAPPAQPRCRA